jgi:Tol biopolymer transport system component
MAATTRNRATLKSFLLVSISLLLSPLAPAQAPRETLLSTDNAYNPIPSPDGKLIAYVRTGWGRPNGSGGFGRSNLVSEVAIIDASGVPVTKSLLTDSFLSGWTPDGTKLACYRDWEYALISPDGRKTTSGRIPNEPQRLAAATEWVAYAPSRAAMVWSRHVDDSHSVIESSDATVARANQLIGQRVVPSPDGRYFAVFGESAESPLWVYDTQLESWTDLARIRIHPDSNWSYIQPSWNPWFADGSHLVYFSDSVLTVSTPDGRQKTKIRIDAEAGLPTPSPDGLSVAFVTFEPRPMRVRPDLSFWGNSTIWVVSPVPGAQPRAVTQKNSDETYDLRWLNSETLVFDRIADESFYQHARLWKTTAPR